ncbi:hypothetical protein [Cryobacterium zhongshanensis]|uniref:Antitoxin Xre/MbcA/ParS-like toxin-binding domain-containing protein n=1 Tax=Cryobacterium zhongshanensis TaxID=2928153 RepID=A0AA41QU28_9MICO|nr:hypothetical protein [Cryobacterium zhongshanensis]MCI4657330.1 hypothetical protein [Cryobacterium zhongshanensis]
MTDNHAPDAVTSERLPKNAGFQVPDEAVRRLAEAVARLANDPDYFIQALTEMLLAMEPTSFDELPENEVRFLMESGAFTAETWASTSEGKGSPQLRMTEGWLVDILATMSLDDVRGFLGWEEERIGVAVAHGHLYAVEISGSLRFPTWQFNVGSPAKLLPGLTEIIELVMSRWHWRSVAGFMATPQSDLVAKGRQTPVAWLRDGGDIKVIIDIVEAADWT